MRASRLVAALAVVVPVLVLVILGATRSTTLAFTTAVAPDVPMVRVTPGGLGCQNVADVRVAFDRVLLPLDDGIRRAVRRAPGRVEVRRSRDGAVLAAGRLPARWPEYPAYEPVRLDRTVATGQAVDVCVLNRGRKGAISIFGSAVSRFPGSPAVVQGGESGGGRLTMRFERPATTRLADLPTTVDRIALLHASWVHPWLVWALLGLVVLAVPAALLVVLRRSEP